MIYTPSKHSIASILTAPRHETIFGIVGRMQVLLEYFSSKPEYAGLIPFLNTYYIITKTVALRMHQEGGQFKHPQALERLDVYFASLYFKPLLEYLETGKAPRPWRTYFEYCAKPNGISFLQMLLGINAHINGDLSKTLVHVGDADRQDFLKINAILKEKIPEVMSFLAFRRYDTLGLGAFVFKSLVQDEFEHVVVKWREYAWHNAGAIKLRLSYGELHIQTEQAAERLAAIFNSRYDITQASKHLHAIRALHVKV